ncbi:hypothetical protein SAMN04487948_10442 [Halogranum amylolyticum]|uniref:LexA-binding, inner membrane-associated hydrolase n=1 Tax=Halogranum amylolyticum TaxID=660520 RepID=A0A1H8RJ46_9EURY|nr:hypothetical protein [Halogranum amylolyticum]SEO66188.1 hypothetical protein SAMN04487948_10442 [Halogranum amylolyticum]
MSFAIGHFALGATVTALIVTYLLPRLPYPRTIVALGGAWALVPDAAKLRPTSRTLVAFHDGQWADIFWLHRTLDRLDATDSPRVSALLVAVFLVVTLLSERRAYRTGPRVHELYDELNRPSRGSERQR